MTLCSASLPIELPWKDERNDFGKQTSPIIVSFDKKCLSPSHKNDGHINLGTVVQQWVLYLRMMVSQNPRAVLRKWMFYLGLTLSVWVRQKISEDQQEEITLRKSNRLKQIPISKYQDFYVKGRL